MIAERPIHSYSNNALNELEKLELDGYCDFGFPIAHDAAAWELGNKLAAATTPTTTLPRVSTSKLDLRSSKLDEVVRTFARVFDGKEIQTAELLGAIRAHLELMRSGGAALRLVAKDLEANLGKVEALFERSPEECKTLRSLLELERESDVHEGNVLQDPSAAIGLLWIRRSLAFQSRLFKSLVLPSDDGGGSGRHPKDAACEAYDEHLSPYHGWMLRTVFPASLSQMPHRAVFLSKFGEVEMEDLDEEVQANIARKLRALVGTLEPLIEAWRDCFERLDFEDTRRV